MNYNSNTSFIQAVTKCIDYVNLTTPVDQRVPREIIVAMAVLETGYGSSRFALKGNNLFGIRTWNKDEAQLKPKDNPDVEWGVKQYITKCQSVKDMVSIINRLPVYADFREARAEQLKTGDKNVFALVPLLSEWSTNPNYTNLIISKVKKIQKILAKKVSK
jgi:Bax protein